MFGSIRSHRTGRVKRDQGRDENVMYSLNFSLQTALEGYWLYAPLPAWTAGIAQKEQGEELHRNANPLYRLSQRRWTHWKQHQT